jgi:hypothetical protein
MDQVGEAEVIAALTRAGLPTSGRARLFHATSAAKAAAIEADGTLRGDESGVVWLASSGLIAPLHHSAGASDSADTSEKKVEVLLELEVDVAELLFERTSLWEDEPVELFYASAGAAGFSVEVISSGPWPDPMEGGAFAIGLEFVAECCPGCGEPREPGPCPQCGTEVGESAEVAAIAAARRKALGPVEAKLAAVMERFDVPAKRNIVVSNDQFATAVSDARIFELIGEMVVIGNELQTLDLNDRAVIGRELRQALVRRVSQVEELAKACEELALFDPVGPAAELQVVAKESGRYGARLTSSFVAVLVAETIPAARAAEAEMQELLADFPFKDRIGELVAEMWDWTVPDFDARAALVLGRPGDYSDEYGFLDIGAVFVAFAAEDDPLDALARYGRRYFSHLLGEGTPGEKTLESFLVAPAIELATLDRPLGAHRIARGVFELLAKSAESAPEAVQALVDRTVGESGLIFAAMEQVKRGARLLAAGEAIGESDEATVLKTAMEAYKDLAETSFRTYGWLVTDLLRIARGEPASEAAGPPTLGSLEAELAGSGELLGERLAESCDSALRNACAHAQYIWDGGSEAVLDLRSGRRWLPEELSGAVAALGAAIAGADAGYTCYLVGSGAQVKAPAWTAGGAGPGLAKLAAEASFGPRGFRVLRIEDAGRTVVIAGEGEREVGPLMAALAGVSVLAGPGQVVAVLDESGRALLSVEAEAFRRSAAAPERFADLAVVGPFIDNALRGGRDPQAAPVELVSVQVNQVVRAALAEAGEGNLDAAAMLRAGDRFGYVLESARAQVPERGEDLEWILRRVSRCRSAAFRAGTGDQEAIRRYLDAFQELNDWVEERGIVWPPRAAAD